MDLSTILEMEMSISKMLNEEKNKIVEEIRTSPIDGVTPINNLCFSISLSALQYGVLSPDYYSPVRQADYVDYALKNRTTATEFISTIKKLIEEKKVKKDGNYYHLNNQTIIILSRYLLKERKN